MKPSWTEAPEWANWLAQDANGQWYWHEDKPMLKPFAWMSDDDSTIFAGKGHKTSSSWRKSLEARPSPVMVAPADAIQAETAKLIDQLAGGQSIVVDGDCVEPLEALRLIVRDGADIGAVMALMFERDKAARVEAWDSVVAVVEAWAMQNVCFGGEK